MRRRVGVAGAGVFIVAGALTAASCGKSDPTTILLSVNNAIGILLPEEVRLNVYDHSGTRFSDVRLPAQGTLTPAGLPLLGTVVIYVNDPTSELRLEAHGMTPGQRVSQGIARCVPQAGHQIAVDLTLQAGALLDSDSDGVPDGIDNCVFLSNTQQTDADADGVGDPCSGSDGGIRGGARNGTPCTGGTGCDSGHCVDAFCCDSDCTDTCHSCGLAGAQGTCTAIAEGQDAQGDCAQEPVATCGRTGKCGPGSTCALYADGQACAAAACANGSQSSSRTCDGAGACRPAVVAACGIYACDGPVCAGSCSSDAHCAGGYYCVAPACVPKLEVGAACAAANQCNSGFCADGICCATDCSGACKSCVIPTVGTCTAYAAGTDPDADCAQGLACTGAGACFTRCTQDQPDCESGYYCGANACAAKKADGVACGAANQCNSGFCTDGVCCAEACAETCKSCNLSGAVGQCTFVPSGSRDPNGPNACSPPNRCDGAGTCQ
jgi:hypothetical protein